MPLALSTSQRGPLQAAEYLRDRRAEIIAATQADIAARSMRYAEATEPVLRERMNVLFDTLTDALAAACLLPLLDHAHEIAKERFRSGYGLSDVQRAYNSLEEAIWARVFAEGDLERYRIVLPWVSAAIGAAKDELARDYVKLAAGDHAPSIDVTALFRGGTRL
jgi:hypothetical protein